MSDIEKNGKRSDYGVTTGKDSSKLGTLIDKLKTGKAVLTQDEYHQLYDLMMQPGSKIHEEMRKKDKHIKQLDDLASKLAVKVKSKLDKGESNSVVDNIILNVGKKNNLDNMDLEIIRAKIRDNIHSDRMIKNKINGNAFSSSINKAIGGPFMMDLPFTISDKEQPILADILKKYNESQLQQHTTFAITTLYEDCGPLALSSREKRDYTPNTDYIHPIFFILLVPKYPVFENLVMLSNYGRIISRRYQKKPIDNIDDIILLNNIRSDPNEFAYSTSNSPLEDIRSRYEAQLAFQKIAYCVRNGMYNNCPDHAKFIKAVSMNPERDYFDSNYKKSIDTEIYLTQNYDPSINFTRMIYANWSYRPIVLSTVEEPGMASGYMNMPMMGNNVSQHPMAYNLKTTLETIPYLSYYVQKSDQTYQLQDALTGFMWYPKKDRMVLKKHSVLTAIGLLTIHVIKQRMIYTTNLNTNLNPEMYSFFNTPLIESKYEDVSSSNLTINEALKTDLDENLYYLRGVLCKKVIEVEKKKFPANEFGLVKKLRDPENNVWDNSYYIYDPMAPMVPVKTENTNEWYLNSAVNAIAEHGGSDFFSNVPVGFFELAQKYGTLFLYSKKAVANKNANAFTFQL